MSSISPVALDGVVEQVRTAGTVMVAEIHKNAPEGTEIPVHRGTSNAVAFAGVVRPDADAELVL